MANCVKCGAELAQDEMFCPSCGTPRRAPQVAAPSARRFAFIPDPESCAVAAGILCIINGLMNFVHAFQLYLADFDVKLFDLNSEGWKGVAIGLVYVILMAGYMLVAAGIFKKRAWGWCWGIGLTALMLVISLTVAIVSTFSSVLVVFIDLAIIGLLAVSWTTVPKE
jgi:hypothetical protein